MAAKRVLIIANELVADRPASVPEVVLRQVDEADEVRVVAPALTGKLHSWVSDIDAERLEADERMRALVGDIGSSGKDVRGRVGDEDPLQAVADALALFPADALIIGVHPPDDELARAPLHREGARTLRAPGDRVDLRPRGPRHLGHDRVTGATSRLTSSSATRTAPSRLERTSR